MDEHLMKTRWTYILRAALIMACASILYSWSIFVTPLIEYHGWELTVVAMVASVELAFYAIGSFTGGKLNAIIGPRKSLTIGTFLFGLGIILTGLVPSSAPWLIYVTYSMISGLGIGISYNVGAYSVARWYPDKKGLAMGIVLAAYGGATAFLAPLASALIGQVGVINTFYILGVVFLTISLICALTFKAPPEGFNPVPAGTAGKVGNASEQRSYTASEAARTRQFWLFAIPVWFYPTAYLSMAPLFVVFGVSRGMTLGMATLGVSTVAVAQIIGRILLSAMQDKVGYKTVYTIAWSCTIISLVLLILSVQNVSMIFVGYIFLGLGYAGSTVVYTFASIEVFGPKYSGAIYGLSLMIDVPLFIILPRIFLAILESTGGYTASLIMAGVLCTIAWLCMISIKPIAAPKK